MSDLSRPAADTACAACPWRTANQGRRHPDGWYTRRNLTRLWAGLRRGERMSCHPTDQTNPVPPGARRVPPGTPTRECSGALVLVQRELWLMQERHDGDPKTYRAARPRGLTTAGMARHIAAMVFGGTPFIGGLRATRVNLNESAVGYPPLGEWREVRCPE